MTSPQNNGANKKTPELGRIKMEDTSPSTRPSNNSDSSSISATTPTKPGCSLKADLSSSASPPRRSRSRRGPVRSLSTPLSRSFSARLPSAHRYRSDRFADRLTTYKDDFRSPEDLSYKLQSLNLETSVRALSDSSTTYRDSYRWPSWRRRDIGAPADNTSQPQNAASGLSSRESQFGSPSAVGSSTPRSSVSAAANEMHAKTYSKGVEFCDSIQNDKRNHSTVKYIVRRPVLLSNDPLWLAKNDKVPKASRTTPSSEETISIPTSP